ncbi:MAG: bacillithiol system redox-active protein YtxJ [Gemmatimonadaceae bacterium]
MHELKDERGADALFEASEAVLLKHGAHCIISAGAREEIAAFEEAHPRTEVFAVEVTGQRDLSDQLATRLGVRHQSPQVFVLRRGAVTWHATHHDITAEALEEHTGG